MGGKGEGDKLPKFSNWLLTAEHLVQEYTLA